MARPTDKAKALKEDASAEMIGALWCIVGRRRQPGLVDYVKCIEGQKLLWQMRCHIENAIRLNAAARREWGKRKPR